MIVPGERVRCHPSVIVEKSLSVVVLIALLVTRLEATAVAGVLAAAIVALLLFNYRQWKLTTIRFGETEIVVERDTLFKAKKTLPYAKIASVNVNRGIVNRLFGTSKLQININSGSSATVPEAALTFGEDMADELRSAILGALHDGEVLPDEDEATESLVSFSPADVIVHGLFSVPTYQTIFGSVFLAYSVFELYTSAGAGIGGDSRALVSLLMFFVVQFGPAVSLIFRYYNYRVYRRGETIFLQHGLLRTYKTSFEVSRINAVRVKSTLAARLLHRSWIEAEVVGLASGTGESLRPVLCLLKDDATQQRLLRELAPEFVYDRSPERQPAGAWSVLLIRAAIASFALVLAMVWSSLYVYHAATALAGIAGAVLPWVLPLATILGVLAIFYATHVSCRITEFDTSKDLFTFVNGAVDRETVVMSYDRVQMVRVERGPVAGFFGVARARVYLLSSTGGTSISSGYFFENRLGAIGETVMERIASGEYDWRRNSV